MKFAEATALFRVTFFSLLLGICLSFCPALRPCSTFRCSSPPARPLPAWQLTKRALVGGDTERVALEWANEQVWAGCTGQIAGRREAAFRSIGHFPQVRAGVPLTRSAESSSKALPNPGRRAKGD